MAYKTFQNGYPLPASDLNNYLMNQSVIVFASSAARTADIPTPIEGMITYLEDTNAVEVWDGSAWQNINDNSNSVPLSTVAANGDLIVGDGASSVTNLTVGANGSLLYSDGTDPSWLANSGTEGDVLQVNATGGLEFATPAGGGGMTQIATGSFSGSLSITSIPTTYKHLQLVLTNAALNFDSPVYFRLNADTSANYIYRVVNHSGTALSNGNEQYIVLTQATTESTDTFNSVINVYDYAATSGLVTLEGITAGIDSGSNKFVNQLFAGYQRSAAITGISIVFVTGTAGTYTLYGVN